MVNRRVFLTGTAGAALTAVTAVTATATAAATPAQPLALVYRGPASLPYCPEAVATLLQSSPSRFRTAFVGPNEAQTISPSTLAGATVYAQPGGAGLAGAWEVMRPYADTLRAWVASGGTYLGFCLGGYLAGATPGFNLLPGDTWQYITAPNATVTSAAPSRIEVLWRGRPESLYFEDGPTFWLQPGADVEILATYLGGYPAALVAPFGSGRVGVVGPHVEADRYWFGSLDSAGAVNPGLGHDLIETAVRR